MARPSIHGLPNVKKPKKPLSVVIRAYPKQMQKIILFYKEVMENA